MMENGLPARLVMALDRARAEDTPLPVPDMSSPSSSLENFSFTISASATHQSKSCFSNKIAIRNSITGVRRRRSKKDGHLRAGPHAGPAWAAPLATTSSRPPPYPTGRRPAAAEGPPRADFPWTRSSSTESAWWKAPPPALPPWCCRPSRPRPATAATTTTTPTSAA